MDLIFPSACLVILALLCARSNCREECEELKKKDCLGMALSFNFTTTGIANDSQDQNKIEENLHKWQALRFLPRCWEVLHPLLCGVYKPNCERGHVRLPCRSHCLKTRAPCNVVERYHQYGGWPDFLKCGSFPQENCDNFTVRNCLMFTS